MKYFIWMIPHISPLHRQDSPEYSLWPREYELNQMEAVVFQLRRPHCAHVIHSTCRIFTEVSLKEWAYSAQRWNSNHPRFMQGRLASSYSHLSGSKSIGCSSALLLKTTPQTSIFPCSRRAAVLSMHDLPVYLLRLYSHAWLSSSSWVVRIYAQSANLEIAARRIVYAKNTNCGQLCVSPDYVLVHEKVKRAPRRAGFKYNIIT